MIAVGVQRRTGSRDGKTIRVHTVLSGIKPRRLHAIARFVVNEQSALTTERIQSRSYNPCEC